MTLTEFQADLWNFYGIADSKTAHNSAIDEFLFIAHQYVRIRQEMRVTKNLGLPYIALKKMKD